MNWIKKHKKPVVVLGILVILGIAATPILPQLLKSPDTPVMQARQNTVELAQMDLTESVSATGTIESAKVKTVAANISNVEIKSVKVTEGDVVRKGQTLLTFDQSELQNTLSEAQENLSDAKSQADSEMASAKRKLSEAQDTYKTQKKQMNKNVLDAKNTYKDAKKDLSQAKTDEEKQKASEAVNQAKSAYEQAKNERTSNNKQNLSNVESAKEQITTTENNNKKSLREAERSVTDAKEALVDATITSSMNGVVTAVSVEAGDVYSGGTMFEISDCDDLQVNTTVTEYDVAKVKKGQKVVILTDATGDTEISGTITYVALTTGSSSQSSTSTSAGGSTGTVSMGTSSSSGTSGYEVRIAIEDTNETLRVGMTAKCSIILEEVKDVYAVPYDAIHCDTSGNDVIYIKDSTGAKKEIKVTKGMESDYYVEVRSDEISDGMQVIIPSDATSTSNSSTEKEESALDGFMGGSGNKGNRSNSGGFGGGGMPAKAPGM